MAQRGFTLVELLVACAVIAVLLAAAIPLTLASRPGAAATSALQFDSAIARAQSLAATSGNGATLQFTTTQSGTAIRVYAGRPNGSGMSQSGADLQLQATVAEISLRAPPFAVFFDTSGHASGMRGRVDPSATIATDPGCPAQSTIAITIRDARTALTRSLPCSAAP